MPLPLQQDLKADGMNQGDLYNVLSNALDIVNELQADHATMLADITAIRAAIVAITAQLDLDSGVNDTDYASNNDPAALTTSALTNNTALTLNAG